MLAKSKANYNKTQDVSILSPMAPTAKNLTEKISPVRDSTSFPQIFANKKDSVPMTPNMK